MEVAAAVAVAVLIKVGQANLPSRGPSNAPIPRARAHTHTHTAHPPSCLAARPACGPGLAGPQMGQSAGPRPGDPPAGAPPFCSCFPPIPPSRLSQQMPLPTPSAFPGLITAKRRDQPDHGQITAE